MSPRSKLNTRDAAFESTLDLIGPSPATATHKMPLDGLVVYFWNTLDLSRTRSPYFSVLASSKIAWRKVGMREKRTESEFASRQNLTDARRRVSGLFYGNKRAIRASFLFPTWSISTNLHLR